MLTTREMYHILRRTGCAPLKRVRTSPIHHAINDRAGYAQILRSCVEDGKIGVARSGMDCDCTQYSYVQIMDAPSGAIKFAREEDFHYSSLDGTESTQWLKPSECIIQSHSRDLALEAYEDGHPHVVYIA